MSRVGTAIEVPGAAAEADALWHDLGRWPSFVDGFRHLAKREGDWPAVGGVVVWDTHPGGRGRVVERVTARAPAAGQTAAVEDAQLRGTQAVSFAEQGARVRVALELDYELKQGGPLRRIADALFIRRAIGDSLRRTLDRFARELEADREPLR